MIIIIHSSKTMKSNTERTLKYREPELIEYSQKLIGKLSKLSIDEIQNLMKISKPLANKTFNQIHEWGHLRKNNYSPAVYTFIGDIYSGLQSISWNEDDIKFADQNLRILSGLYGILKPLDSIHAYRLEMGYKLRVANCKDLYQFWGDKIYKQVSSDKPILNLSSVEYSLTITRYAHNQSIITPKFLTINQNSGIANSIAVHSKIARGALANWVIKNKITSPNKIINFSQLGYKYSKDLSTANQPVYICEKFEGLGMSIRLS